MFLTFFGCIEGWLRIEPGLAPAELSALLRLFKRRDRSNRLREPVEQHEEVTKFFSRKERKQEQEWLNKFDEIFDEFYLILTVFCWVVGCKDGGSFSFGQEMPQPSRCQVPELREAWHWQMPYAFAQEQLVVEIFVSWIYLRSTPRGPGSQSEMKVLGWDLPAPKEGTLLGTNISHFKGTFEDDFPIPQVGYVNSLVGNSSSWLVTIATWER